MGWGWFEADGNAVPVPSEFTLDAEIIERGKPFVMALGQITEPHALTGMWILLTQRHDPPDGGCSLHAFRQRPAMPPNPSAEPADISGYAEVEPVKRRRFW
jgi:hypothetical protein